MKIDLQECIFRAQDVDEWCKEVKVPLSGEEAKKNKVEGYSCDDDGMVRLKQNIVVPDQYGLCELILKEAHHATYMAHPGVQKMYADLKQIFFWEGMKKDVANFVEKCLECQLLKAEHGHPTGLLQPHNIPESKWEEISIEFIFELTEKTKKHNSILVVVDKLTKSAHFIPVRDTYRASEIAQVFIKEVVRIHGFPKKIISDRASIFTGRF